MKDGMVIENVHYSALHVPGDFSIVIIASTKHKVYIKIICCRLSLNCPSDIMIEFVSTLPYTYAMSCQIRNIQFCSSLLQCHSFYSDVVPYTTQEGEN
jgi:hypothetical protein